MGLFKTPEIVFSVFLVDGVLLFGLAVRLDGFEGRRSDFVAARVANKKDNGAMLRTLRRVNEWINEKPYRNGLSGALGAFLGVSTVNLVASLPVNWFVYALALPVGFTGGWYAAEKRRLGRLAHRG